MFGKNKKKIDSKVRFQNRGFKNRLSSQRNYKRSPKILPQTDWGVFLKKAGLGSWLSRILTLGVFLFLVYIVYIPNFFFVKQVTISGLDPVAETGLKESINSFLEKKTPWPQKNLLLLSKPALEQYIIGNDQDVLAINKLEKKFPSTLVLNIEARKDEFLIETSDLNYFTVSQDGLITSEIYPDASGTLPSQLVLIKLDKDVDLNLNQKPFMDGELKFIEDATAQIPAALKIQITSFELSDFEDPYLQINTQNGYIIKLDSSADFNKTLSRLNLLIGQILPGDLKNLYYIDLRFTDRAYTCSKSSACATDTTIPAATTTPPSLTN